MDSIKKSFKDRRFRYGSFSTVMIIVAVGLFILVNMVATQLNISRDLTREQLFTLSSGSIRVLGELNEDVTIYSLWPTGQEHFLFQRLLEEYASSSNHVTLINRDPLLHPAFVDQFAMPDEPIANGSIIVVGPERHRVIHAEDLVNTQFNWNTFSNEVTGFAIEPQVTNAINFVVAEESPVIYRVVGSGEFDLPEALLQEIEIAGFELRGDVNLVTNEVPEDADLLFITMPEVGRDWAPEKARRMTEFLENEGRAIFVLGFRSERFPNMDEVLANFGVRLGDYVIIEGSSGHFLMNNPLMLLAEFAPSDLTNNLIERDFRPFLEHATGIEILEMRRPATIVETVVLTSAQAYGRNDPDVAGITRVAQDLGGPFNLAVTVEDSFFVAARGHQSLTTRMFVIGSESILSEAHNQALGGANWNLLISGLNWLRDMPSPIVIPAQSVPATQPLVMNQTQANMIFLFSVVILPLAFGLTGLVVWLRRRNA